MGMTRQATDALFQKYLDLLVRAGYPPKRCDTAVGQVQNLNLNHVAWMCETAITFEDAEKKQRWLGFVQGSLWTSGHCSIDALKGDVVTAYQNDPLAQIRAQIDKSESKVFKREGSLYCRMEGCREFAEYVEGHRSIFCKKHMPILSRRGEPARRDSLGALPAVDQEVLMHVYSVKLEHDDDASSKKEVFVVASSMEDALRLAQDSRRVGYGWKAMTTYKLMEITAVEGMSE
jgi:hypothetical protein